MDEQSAVPALLGRYRPHRVIGRGGMATVYQATDETIGREVAIKLFKTATPLDIGRHRSELRVLGSLNHHGIVTLIDAGTDDSAPDDPHPFLVMELIRGRDLGRELAERSFSAREISEIAFDLAEALEYVHLRGVVHRDIKPTNVMLVQYGTSAYRARAKLTDFGIALDADGARLTVDEATTGTAAYLSPEVVRRGDPTPASDVYALGLVLLECFTGELAYPGDAVQSAVERLVTDPRIPSDLPGSWSDILQAMTDRDPSRRPTAADLVIAFRHEIIEASGRHRVAPELLAEDEDVRMAAVRRYDVLDSGPDESFDRIAALAARTTSSPIALVSLVDGDRIWFKARHGTREQHVARDLRAHAAAGLHDEPWAIADLSEVGEAAVVFDETGIRASAGTPLRTPDGIVIGTLCVLDTAPHPYTGDDLATLADLAALVMHELERRRADAAVATLLGTPTSPDLPFGHPSAPTLLDTSADALAWLESDHADPQV
ncbi:protein kinase domain-containing protein [Pseudolysinimonas sp.]|uniref:serine/threonine-protein kinase n=1 Tax=Pseudolysinimonas sp. TaxID=2680009 RepID=UPI003F7EFF33